MIIKETNLQTDRYPISTKCYLPEDGEIKGVILGVHGFAGDKESSALRAVAERGTAEGQALICFDLPSHGASPVNEACFSVENCLKDTIFMADYIKMQFPKSDKYCFANRLWKRTLPNSGGSRASADGFPFFQTAPENGLHKILCSDCPI